MKPHPFPNCMPVMCEHEIDEVCYQCHARRGRHKPPVDGQPESCPGAQPLTWGVGTFDPSGRYMTPEQAAQRGGGQVGLGLEVA